MLTAQDHPYRSSQFGYRAEIKAVSHISHQSTQLSRHGGSLEKQVDDVTGVTKPDSRVLVVQTVKTVQTRREWDEKDIGIGLAL